MLVAEVLSGRVRAALAGGDVGAARALCRARLRDCGEEAVTLRCLAQVELAAGQLDAALEWGRRACALAPEEAMSWLALGHAQALSAQWSEAARSFSRATRRAPDSGDAWHNLGVARRHQGDSAAALAAFKQAVWVDAGRADSWLAMARLLQADSQADNALGCYRRAASRDPAALPEYADALRAHGQLEEAAGRYREALRRDIEPVRSGFGLGQVLEALGRRERAEGAYLEVLASRPPDRMPSAEHRAMVLETLAEIDRALDRLPARVRETFVLSQFEGLTYSAIAERLGVSVASVRKYMLSAATALLATLHAPGVDSAPR